jgi:apolipoprotein N-acyltransferase
MSLTETSQKPDLSLIKSLFYACGAVAAFHLAYIFEPLAFLVGASLFLFILFSRDVTRRRAFYGGIAIGMAMYGPQLYFFWGIFSVFAVVLWLILAFWVGVFMLIANVLFNKYGAIRTAILLPFLWTGIEYFRSELYTLRFTWLTPGLAFAHAPWKLGMHWIGVYGIGFLLMVCAAIVSMLGKKKAIAAGIILFAALALVSNFGSPPGTDAMKSTGPITAGIQLEFPSFDTVLSHLEKTRAANPDIELFVLSEYTFFGPVPEKIRNWCREKKKYLVAGGQDWFGKGKNDFYNTAFVIGPDGEVVFKQVKCVPIQFFADGAPAKEQKLWDSPWGKIGICICYDFSYTRVVDRLVGMGARILIVPTMDTVEWGEHEHKLHARIATVRAAEYGVPVWRVGSSGISQYVADNGVVRCTAPFPGQEETLIACIETGYKGSLPLDRYLAPLASLITGLTIAWLLIMAAGKKFLQKKSEKESQPAALGALIRLYPAEPVWRNPGRNFRSHPVSVRESRQEIPGRTLFSVPRGAA